MGTEKLWVQALVSGYKGSRSHPLLALAPTSYLVKLSLPNYRPKRSFGQGNIFTPVCHSFCSQGGSTWPGTPPPGPGTTHPPRPHTPPEPGTPPPRPPRDQVPPLPQTTPPGTRYTPWTTNPSTPPRTRYPPRPPLSRSSNLRNAVNDRPVRILLECILVLVFYLITILSVM